MFTSRRTFEKLLKLCLTLVFIFSLFTSVWAQSSQEPKVVLQAYWWDSRNNNYTNDPDKWVGWANYLSDLAPRLRGLGIEAIWVPSPVKGNAGSYDMGYTPYDHYDLGDKHQKGTVETKFGTKDDLLRMVAVMHANGIDVIPDLVLNHMKGGEKDNQAPDKYKCNWGASQNTTFDYHAFSGTKNGRWSKRHPNFHPSTGVHEACNEETDAKGWGLDICYWDGAYATWHSPPQYNQYMQKEVMNWGVWLLKQMDFDGVRLDAVKHFPTWIAEKFLWTLQHGAGWASNGDGMLAVGEHLSDKSEIDKWCRDVQNRSGTFDFSLRGAIYEMAKPETQGGYDLSKIPGAQQSERGRTMPFVNNHDTQRPELDGSGDYTGTWNSHGNSPPKGSAPLHPLVPTDPNTRIEAAYAIIFAVDGSPQISFEDLFDIGTTGKRFTHLPDNPVDLPVRDYLKNLIWSHEKLEFKKGAYKVRHQSADHLVIERSGKAIIGISDSWSDWQEQWIDTDFAPGTVLHDYSDANSHNIIVQNDKRVEIKTPPCNGTSVRRGYSVWGPAGQSGSLGNRVQRSTTQEWEMADDLGDSDPNSLLQGGALPAGQTATRRTCGKIFSEAGKPIVINAWKGTAGGVDIAVELYGTSGTIVANKIDTANPVTLNYTPSITGDYIIKIRNNNSSNPSQKVWVKATYTAPRAANLHGPSASKSNTSMAKENVTNPEDIFMATSYPNYFNQ